MVGIRCLLFGYLDPYRERFWVSIMAVRLGSGGPLKEPFRDARPMAG